MIKKILIVLVLIFVLIQFFRPEKNDSNDLTFDMSTKYEVPENINIMLQGACNDCHTNKTNYPWYSKVQPAAWWLNEHVNNGKSHLNFSSFTKLPLAIQYHKFEEMVEMVEEHEMPLPSYTYLGLHSEANLSDEQRKELVTWVKTQMTTMKATYPADSLIRKRRR